jgi:hypothetical protein
MATRRKLKSTSTKTAAAGIQKPQTEPKAEAPAGKADKPQRTLADILRKRVPLSVYRGLESQEANDRRNAAQNETYEIEWRAKKERYRENVERARHYLADARIREHWLRQAEPAFAEAGPEWRTRRLTWPKDTALVYALMLLCADDMSKLCILPELLKQTEAYKRNKNVTWVWLHDHAGQFMAYIETDLRAEGLLGQIISGKKRKGSPGLPGPEAKKRLRIMKKWDEQKGGISRKDFCAEEGITVGYFETCRKYDYSINHRAKK